MSKIGAGLLIYRRGSDGQQALVGMSHHRVNVAPPGLHWRSLDLLVLEQSGERVVGVAFPS
jgi:hypothetical protein